MGHFNNAKQNCHKVHTRKIFAPDPSRNELSLHQLSHTLRTCREGYTAWLVLYHTAGKECLTHRDILCTTCTTHWTVNEIATASHSLRERVLNCHHYAGMLLIRSPVLFIMEFILWKWHCDFKKWANINNFIWINIFKDMVVLNIMR